MIIENTLDGGSFSGNSDSYNFTATGGEDHVLVVSVSGQCNTPSSVSFNGDNLTSAVSISYNGFSTSIWYIVNPDGGEYLVEISGLGLFGSIGGSSVVEYSGVDILNPIDDTDSTSGSAKTASLTLTTTESESYLVSALAVNGFWSNSLTPTPTQVALHLEENNDVDNASGHKYVEIADDTPISWTWSGSFSENYSYCAIALRGGVVSLSTDNNVSVSEYSSVEVPYMGDVDKFEFLVLSDSVSADLIVNLNVYDDIGVVEDFEVDPGHLYLITNETISLSEDISPLLKNLVVLIPEEVLISEYENPEKDPIEILVAESISFIDYVEAGYTRTRKMYEDIAISESVIIDPPDLPAVVHDNISVNDVNVEEIIGKVLIVDTISLDSDLSFDGIRQGHSYSYNHPRGGIKMI